jgi:hypothetical protein
VEKFSSLVDIEPPEMLPCSGRLLNFLTPPHALVSFPLGVNTRNGHVWGASPWGSIVYRVYGEYLFWAPHDGYAFRCELCAEYFLLVCMFFLETAIRWI